MRLDVSKALAANAQGVVSDSLGNLARGRSVNDAPLAPKARPDGRQVGAGLEDEIRGARALVRRDQFELTWQSPKLEAFQNGVAGRQPARPVIGISQAREARIRGDVQRDVTRQLNAALRRVS